MKHQPKSIRPALPALLLLVALALSACTSGETETATATIAPAPTEEPAAEPTTPPAEEPTATAEPEATPTIAVAEGECAAPTADTQLIENRAQGYCLLLPAAYLSSETSPGDFDYFVGSQLGVSDPRLFVHIEGANGRTPDQAADEWLAFFGLPFEPERNADVTLAGEPVVQLDGVPGQDIQRILFVVHEDRLYRLTLVPAGPDDAIYEATLALYDQLLDSWRFFPAEGEIPVVEQPPVDEAVGLCPDLPRPAIALFVPGAAPGEFLFLDPLSGANCNAVPAGEPMRGFQAAAGALYYTLQPDEQLMVHRLSESDNTLTPLDFTAAAFEDALVGYNFVVSPDGSQIAWAVVGEAVGRLYVAGVDGSDLVTPLPDFENPAEGFRALTPVRFSADGSTLFYTLQPVGIGGSWIGFNGRYDNLYALRLRTEAPPELIFDCATIGSLLCIGDFSELDGAVNALAYTNGTEVVILNGSGETLNSITLEHDYVGYPTFGPGGDLVFYGADLLEETDGPPTPEMGYLYRVAPPTAPHELLVSDPGLLYPAEFLDGATVLVNYVHDNNWGVAIAGLDGTLTPLLEAVNASFVEVVAD